MCIRDRFGEVYYNTPCPSSDGFSAVANAEAPIRLYQPGIWHLRGQGAPPRRTREISPVPFIGAGRFSFQALKCDNVNTWTCSAATRSISPFRWSAPLRLVTGPVPVRRGSSQLMHLLDSEVYYNTLYGALRILPSMDGASPRSPFRAALAQMDRAPAS